MLSHSEGTGEACVWWRPAPSAAEIDRGVRGEGTPRAQQEAERRARREVRRYCVANGLDRLMTLTFRDSELPENRTGVWECVEDFRRKLHDELGERIPLVVTIERGSLKGRLHVHVAFGRFLEQGMVERIWGRGFVDVRRLHVGGEGKRAGCRRAAGYVAKYVTKDDLDDRELNQRRYSVTVGFKPVRRSQRVRSFLDGLELAGITCGGAVEYRWDSSEDPDWCGPPVHVVAFGDPAPKQ